MNNAPNLFVRPTFYFKNIFGLNRGLMLNMEFFSRVRQDHTVIISFWYFQSLKMKISHKTQYFKAENVINMYNIYKSLSYDKIICSFSLLLISSSHPHLPSNTISFFIRQHENLISWKSIWFIQIVPRSSLLVFVEVSIPVCSKI